MRNGSERLLRATRSDFSALSPRGGAGPSSGPEMQNVINTVKGKALEVAEYLTPVLKVGQRPALALFN